MTRSRSRRGRRAGGKDVHPIPSDGQRLGSARAWRIRRAPSMRCSQLERFRACPCRSLLFRRRLHWRFLKPTQGHDAGQTEGSEERSVSCRVARVRSDEGSASRSESVTEPIVSGRGDRNRTHPRESAHPPVRYRTAGGLKCESASREACGEGCVCRPSETWPTLCPLSAPDGKTVRRSREVAMKDLIKFVTAIAVMGLAMWVLHYVVELWWVR